MPTRVTKGAPAPAPFQVPEINIEQRAVAPYKCESRPVRIISESPSHKIGQTVSSEHQSCQYPLQPDDLLIGMSVCKDNINRAPVARQSWGGWLPTVFLGHRKLRQVDVMVTGVKNDDYTSTLGKGFLGLLQMYKQFPNKKWYALVDDDVFVVPYEWVRALSAFNPNEPWVFSQCSWSGNWWRLFGGAGIVLSQGVLAKLGPKLQEAYNRLFNRNIDDARPLRILVPPKGFSSPNIPARRHQLLDVSLPRYINALGIRYHHLDGLYSQGPGFYLGTDPGRKDLQRMGGMTQFPLSFHYARGDFVLHLDYLVSHFTVSQQPGGVNVAVGLLAEPGVNGPGKINQVVPATWAKDFGNVHYLYGPKTWTPDAHCLSWLTRLASDAPGAEWYLLVDSTAYVVLTNLKQLVVGLDPKQPRLLSNMRTAQGRQHPTLASGMLLSAGLVKKLVQAASSLPAGAIVDEPALAELVEAIQPGALQHADNFLASTSTVPTSGPAGAASGYAVTIPTTFGMLGMKKDEGEVEKQQSFLAVHYLVQYATRRGSWFGSQPRSSALAIQTPLSSSAPV